MGVGYLAKLKVSEIENRNNDSTKDDTSNDNDRTSFISRAATLSDEVNPHLHCDELELSLWSMENSTRAEAPQL